MKRQCLSPLSLAEQDVAARHCQMIDRYIAQRRVLRCRGIRLPVGSEKMVQPPRPLPVRILHDCMGVHAVRCVQRAAEAGPAHQNGQPGGPNPRHGRDDLGGHHHRKTPDLFGIGGINSKNHLQRRVPSGAQTGRRQGERRGLRPESLSGGWPAEEHGHRVRGRQGGQEAVRQPAELPER